MLFLYAVLAGITLALTPSFLSILLVSVGLHANRPTVRPSMFVVGMMAGFATVGYISATSGSIFGISSQVIQIVAGVLLALFGLTVTLEGFKRQQAPTSPVQPVGNTSSALSDVRGFFGGIFFGAIWSPSVSAVFTSVLAVAGSGRFVAASMLLFAAYVFGAGLVVILFDHVMNDLLVRYGRHHTFARFVSIPLGLSVIFIALIGVLGLMDTFHTFLIPLTPFMYFTL